MDSLIIVVSVVLAFIISELDLIEKLLGVSEDIRIIGSFIAGLFFTSVFTTAPAIVVLGEISQIEPVFIVALIGAIGAVCGDMIIFHLFRSHVSNDLDAILQKIKRNPFKSILTNKGFCWLGVIVGALIIASPFPDELGIAMMGISRINLKTFIPISFVFNFLGIVVIGYASRLIV